MQQNLSFQMPELSVSLVLPEEIIVKFDSVLEQKFGFGTLSVSLPN